MRLFLLISLLASLVIGPAFAQKPKQFYVLQRSTHKGLEQLSLSLNPDGQWLLTSNTNGFISVRRQAYGLFSVKMESKFAARLKAISQAKKMVESQTTFSHGIKFFVDGKGLHDSNLSAHLFDVFSAILSSTSLTAINGGWVELVEKNIKFDLEKNGKSVLKESKSQEEFCKSISGKVCVFEFGLIDLERL